MRSFRGGSTIRINPPLLYEVFQGFVGGIEGCYSLTERVCFAKRSRGQTSDYGVSPRLVRRVGNGEVSDPPAEEFEEKEMSLRHLPECFLVSPSRRVSNTYEMRAGGRQPYT